jgi:hypothetical protein
MYMYYNAAQLLYDLDKDHIWDRGNEIVLYFLIKQR